LKPPLGKKVTGKLVGIYTSAKKGVDKAEVERAELIPDHGLRGDGHAGQDPVRQVSLFADEILGEIKAEGFAVTASGLRANLITAGIPLDSLAPGTQLRIGDAIIEIVEPRQPCRMLTRLDHRLPKRLYGRCGLLGRIVAGGEVRAGDTIETHPQIA
jgi:MOSC domain-containing protein YiiM